MDKLILGVDDILLPGIDSSKMKINYLPGKGVTRVSWMNISIIFSSKAT
jgi:hypothetical protein